MLLGLFLRNTSLVVKRSHIGNETLLIDDVLLIILQPQQPAFTTAT